MGAYVQLKDGRNIEFGIGTNPHTLLANADATLNSIVAVQLGGDELKHLKNSFSNLPYGLTRFVQVWRGDFAKFIIENW